VCPCPHRHGCFRIPGCYSPPVPPCLALASGLAPIISRQLGLPQVKAAYRGGSSIESLSSIGLLELLAPCGGIPDVLAPAIGLIELVPPCGDMPELVSSWEVTVLSKFLPTCESLSPVDSLADPGWL
jgi:hypothetical protein